MKVVVDTSVWSLALRRNTPSQAMVVVNQLRDLIVDGRVVLLGSVRQEVLSGIRYHEEFTRLKEYFRGFPDLELTIEPPDKQLHLLAMAQTGLCLIEPLQPLH
ncbi:hypothetical protein NUACC21_27690 [Scytonema sp. NUACC21]